MAKDTVPLLTFNKGIVDRRGLSRIDVKRVGMAAATQNNMVPRVLGSMSLRPGLQYIVNTASNLAGRLLRFIFGTTDHALIELTNLSMRIIINDVILTRPTVTSAVTNGSFPANINSWTDNDEAGATSSWIAPSYMQLVGDGTARAIRDQTVTVAGGNIGVEHALRIVIARGPVYLRVGSTATGDEYVTETVLQTGIHSLAFTPTGDFYIRFFSSLLRVVWVDSCEIEAAGVVTLTTPWTAALLSSVRYEQSYDVMFVACRTLKQRRIERRGTRPQARSWSITLYEPDDGPFKISNITPITLTASALSGNITLTASATLFKSTHVGSLVAVTSVGQSVSTTSAVTGGVTASIRVTGINTERSFSVIVSGDATVSTVDLQRSYDNATWVNVGATGSYTADVTVGYLDGLNNQIVYYRLRLTNRIAPDNITMSLSIGSGSARGVARITAFTTSLAVSAEVIAAMGGITASDDWQMGSWSDLAGYPTAVRLAEGRLWWYGLNGVWASVSDTLESFDDTVEGDSGPINRTIGSGPVDTINWSLALQRLLIGTDGSEASIRSSSFDEPITPTNFHIKDAGTQGSGNVDAVKLDQEGYFVNRSGARVYELALESRSFDYSINDVTELVPELGLVGIVRMDAQRQPDSRVHCILADGTAMVMVVEKHEEVRAWITIDTDGLIEDVCVLPAATGNLDDQVYYIVKRTINGSTVRFIEKWAQEQSCRGGALSKLADAHIAFTGLSTTFSLPHLPSTEVVVWADGVDVGTDDTTDPENWTQRYTTSGAGLLTLTTAATNVVAGLGYTGQFESAKLGEMLGQTKSATRVALIMHDVHKHGLRVGRDFDVLDNLHDIEAGTTVSSETRTDYDEDPTVLPGKWSTDERLCLQAQAPRSVTVSAAIIDLEGS